MDNNIPDYISDRDILGLEKKKIKKNYFKKPEDIQIPELNVKYATLKLRILAYLIDAAILILPISIFNLIFVFSFYDTINDFRIWDNIINLIVWTIYYGILESSKLQGTIGKVACGLIVIDEYGNKLSFVRAVFRHLAIFISAFPLGFGIWSIAREGKKQGWHDMLLGCYVIKKNSFSKETNKSVIIIQNQSEDSQYENIYNEIQKVKRNIFGEFNTTLVKMLSEHCINIDHANNFLNNYQRLYKKDLVKSICNLSSNYDTIRNYLEPFIEIGIIEKKYPHNRIINNN